MKRTGFIFLAVALLCFWTGCVSAGKKALRTQKDPIALVSVVSNWDINWKGEDSLNPDNIGPLAKRTLREDPDMVVVSNADELINTAEVLIRDIMAGSGLINLVDKQTVLLSRAYREAKINRYQINQELVKPGDYQFIDFRDKNFPPALAAETGIQRSMYVEFEFTKSIGTGFGKFGNCRALVDMSILILDARGKKLYRTTVSLGSRTTTKVMNGVYSGTGLMGLFDSAITDACYDFLDQLQK